MFDEKDHKKVQENNNAAQKLVDKPQSDAPISKARTILGTVALGVGIVAGFTGAVVASTIAASSISTLIGTGAIPTILLLGGLALILLLIGNKATTNNWLVPQGV